MDNFITFEFRIKYKANHGQAIYVLGDHEDFGNWNKKFELEWNEGHIWKKEYEMNINSKCIFFKFVVSEKNNNDPQKFIWEDGPNRILDPKNIDNLSIEDKKYILDCIWSGFKITFNLHDSIDNIDKSHSTMVILGNNSFLGNWEVNKWKEYKMDLDVEKDMRYENEKVWKKNIEIFFNKCDGKREELDFNYKYLIYDYKNNKEQYEGGIDRHIKILFLIDENNDELKFFSLTNPKEYKLLTNSLLVIDDDNFINKNK